MYIKCSSNGKITLSRISSSSPSSVCSMLMRIVIVNGSRSMHAPAAAAVASEWPSTDAFSCHACKMSFQSATYHMSDCQRIYAPSPMQCELLSLASSSSSRCDSLDLNESKRSNFAFRYFCCHRLNPICRCMHTVHTYIRVLIIIITTVYSRTHTWPRLSQGV